MYHGHCRLMPSPSGNFWACIKQETMTLAPSLGKNNSGATSQEFHGLFIFCRLLCVLFPFSWFAKPSEICVLNLSFILFQHQALRAAGVPYPAHRHNSNFKYVIFCISLWFRRVITRAPYLIANLCVCPSRLRVHSSTSTHSTSVAGPLHWNQQAQAGRVLGFSGAAEGAGLGEC